jgi:hypothetical protein
MSNNSLYLPTSIPYELSVSFSDVFAIEPMKLAQEYFGFAVNFKPQQIIVKIKNTGNFIWTFF